MSAGGKGGGGGYLDFFQVMFTPAASSLYEHVERSSSGVRAIQGILNSWQHVQRQLQGLPVQKFKGRHDLAQLLLCFHHHLHRGATSSILY
jgi:hypothetical protein